jgi:hypothetical protein
MRIAENGQSDDRSAERRGAPTKAPSRVRHAAAIWAAYVTALGYLGGEAFKNSTWKPLVVALAIAAAVGLAEIGKRASNSSMADPPSSVGTLTMRRATVSRPTVACCDVARPESAE